MSKFIHSDLGHRSRGDIVEVTLSLPATASVSTIISLSGGIADTNQTGRSPATCRVMPTTKTYSPPIPGHPTSEWA